jgi:serine protease AprX
MLNTYQKAFLGISVMFFISAHGQDLETPTMKSAKQQILDLQKKLKKQQDQQKREVQRLKALNYPEFIDTEDNHKQLVGADEQGQPQYYTTLNAGAGRMVKADRLYKYAPYKPKETNPLEIAGDGMTIGQWDFAKPRLSHELLSGKVTYPSDQNQTIVRHSTNIAGTMVGNNGDAEARGIAYKANLLAYDWVNDQSEMLAQAYDPISNSNGILVANNSYGFDPMYLQSYQFGKYNATAQGWDDIMSQKPYLQIVKAAGNARGLNPVIVPQVSAKQGYDLLEGAGVAKNVLVIASAKKNKNMTSDEDYSVSHFSSYGPTDDGRIKPDFCAPGEEMYSAIETYNSAYANYKGTSSATAVVSGVITLLQQYYKAVNPSQQYMKSATVRALLAHTANDRGTLGPDYIYGWGMVDAERAASAIYNNIESSSSPEYVKKTTLIKELSLQKGKKYILYVQPLDTKQPLTATLAWTDKAGNVVSNEIDLSNSNVVNDLDLKIETTNADDSITTYYPWRLHGMANVLQPASRDAANHVDTIERVDIDPAPQLSKRTYRIIVSPQTDNVEGPLDFSLVVSNVDFCYEKKLTVLKSTAADPQGSAPVTIGGGEQITDNTKIETVIGDIQRSDNFTVGNVQNIHASNKIIPVQPNATATQGQINYIGSDTIRLLPGFQALESVKFRAFITPCFERFTPFAYKAQKRAFLNPSTTNAPTDAIKTILDDSQCMVYPNPVQSEANIRFTLSQASALNIKIFNSCGASIQEINTATYPKGQHSQSIDLSAYPLGTYFMVIKSDDFTEIKKIIKE